MTPIFPLKMNNSVNNIKFAKIFLYLKKSGPIAQLVRVDDS